MIMLPERCNVLIEVFNDLRGKESVMREVEIKTLFSECLGNTMC